LINDNNLDLRLYGNLLKKSWLTKLKLVKSITNNKIDKIIKKLNKDKNIFGTKLLGAGGGGFVLCLGHNLRKIKKNYSCVDFKEDRSGTTIIYKE
jgi:galactokinase/mevalonate kinase-like predicted kinase